MPLNFGTGLAKLLTGAANQTTQNLVKDYAQEQRDKERESVRLQRDQDKQEAQQQKDLDQQNEIKAQQQKAQEGFEYVKPYLDPFDTTPNDVAYQNVSQYDRKNGTTFLNDYLNVKAIQRKTPTVVKDGKTVKNPQYFAEYKETPGGYEHDLKANKQYQVWYYRDPITGEYQTDEKGNKIKKITGLGQIESANQNYIPGVGSSKKTLTPETTKTIFKLAKELIDSRISAQQQSTIPPKDQEFLSDEDKQTYYSKIWTNANSKGEAFRKYMRNILPTSPPANDYFEQSLQDAGGKAPDENVFWDGVKEMFNSGEIDPYGVNLLAYIYLSMYGKYPEGTYYNDKTKEEEIRKDSPKKTVEKKTETKTQPKKKLTKEEDPMGIL